MQRTDSMKKIYNTDRNKPLEDKLPYENFPKREYITEVKREGFTINLFADGGFTLVVYDEEGKEAGSVYLRGNESRELVDILTANL